MNSLYYFTVYPYHTVLSVHVSYHELQIEGSRGSKNYVWQEDLTNRSEILFSSHIIGYRFSDYC